MLTISLNTDSNLDPKSRAWKTVQTLLSAAPFGTVHAAMNQGGLRGFSFTKDAGRAFREAMQTILGYRYSGKIEFIFADYTLQGITLH